MSKCKHMLKMFQIICYCCCLNKIKQEYIEYAFNKIKQVWGSSDKEVSTAF